MKYFFASSKTVWLTMLMALFVTSGCASHGANPSSSANLRENPLNCKKVPSSPHKEQLCVMMTVNRGDMWFFIGNTPYADHSYIEDFSIMDGFPDGPVLSDFSISPSGTYLAIVSAAEGHPTLSFERLSYLRHNEISTETLPAISVYPGNIILNYWLSDSKAVIISNQDLIHYKHGDETGEAREYLLQLPEGKISLYLH